MPDSTFELEVFPERYAIAHLPVGSAVPSWAEGAFVAIASTPHELSIVCPEDAVPGDVNAVFDRRCMYVRGPLSFEQVGVIAGLSRVLADAGVSIFVVSTYDSDYILVNDEQLSTAIQALEAVGHTVRA